VYPELLRSVLLVRLITAFEVFLVDTLLEVSARSIEPFKTSAKVDLTQEHLLTLHAEGDVVSHIVGKYARRLTNEGIEESRDTFKRLFDIDFVAPNQLLAVITEIHDRRHLYVHRGGYADDSYLKKYPAIKPGKDGRIPVPEDYLLSSITTLDNAALRVKCEVEKKYPGEADWKRTSGAGTLKPPPHRIYHLDITAKNAAELAPVIDPAQRVYRKVTLNEIMVWRSENGARCRMTICGPQKEVGIFLKRLHIAESAGRIKQMHIMKVSE